MMITRFRSLRMRRCKGPLMALELSGLPDIRLGGCFCLLKYHLTRLNGVLQ